MSDYDRRYNVHANMVSHYTDDPAEALKTYMYGLEKYESGDCRYPPFINEGYGEWEPYGDHDMVTRVTTGKVLPSTLEYLVQRRRVQKMIGGLHGRN